MAHCTKAPVSIQEYYGTIQRHTKQLSKAIRESQNAFVNKKLSHLANKKVSQL